MATPRLVPRHQLIPPPEPLRVSMQDGPMDELCESIKGLGIIHPLAVLPRWGDGPQEWRLEPDKKLGDDAKQPDAYEIVDGHRRYVAAERTGLDVLPVMVFEDAEAAKYAIMLHANVCREDVTPFEEGVQFLELATKYEWSMDQLRSFFHKSEDYINDRVEVVRKDQAVAAALRDRLITLGQAKEILKCADPAYRVGLLEQASVHGATIGGLREMRRQHDREVAAAQGELPINASPQFVPEGIFPDAECIWCGRGDDPHNIVRIPVHQYHQADLKAAIDTIGLKALIKRNAGIE
jgi:ParB/RepB/Spo0J family partition protein